MIKQTICPSCKKGDIKPNEEIVHFRIKGSVILGNVEVLCQKPNFYMRKKGHCFSTEMSEVTCEKCLQIYKRT